MKKEKEKSKGGRPTDFEQDYCDQAENYCLLGATDKDLCLFFDVAESTLNLWKKKYPQFSEALKRGREVADANVGKSLYQRAIGYSHPDVHISNYQGQITETPITKHYPPDATSMIFWLKNRQRDKWRDKLDHEMSGKDGGPIKTENVTDQDLARRIVFALETAARNK